MRLALTPGLPVLFSADCDEVTQKHESRQWPEDQGGLELQSSGCWLVLASVWSWESYRVSLWFSFLICEVQMYFSSFH